MAGGNGLQTLTPEQEAALPVGTVVTSSGRVSGVTQPGVPSLDYPFTTLELVKLDDALTYGSRAAQVRFAVYIGDLGTDTAAGARSILAAVPDSEVAVLIAVSPNQKAVEVVSGEQIAARAGDRVAQLGVTAAVASFGDGDLIDGLICAVRVMTAAITAP